MDDKKFSRCNVRWSVCTGEYWNEWTLQGKSTQNLRILHLFFFLNFYWKLLKYLKYYHNVSWALTFIYDTISYRHWIFSVEMLQPQDSFQICGGLGMTLSPRYDAHQILASQQLIQKAHQCMSRNVPLSTLTPVVEEKGDPEEGKIVQLKFMHLNWGLKESFHAFL